MPRDRRERAAGQLATLLVPDRKEMQQPLSPVEILVSQIRISFDIPLGVEAAGVDTADQLFEIETSGSGRKKGGLPAVQHRLTLPGML